MPYLAIFLWIIVKAKREKDPTSDYLLRNGSGRICVGAHIPNDFISKCHRAFLRVKNHLSELHYHTMPIWRYLEPSFMRINLVKQAEAELEYQKSRQSHAIINFSRNKNANCYTSDEYGDAENVQ